MAKKRPMVVDPYAAAQPGAMMSARGQQMNAVSTGATAFVRSNRDSSVGPTFEDISSQFNTPRQNELEAIAGREITDEIAGRVKRNARENLRPELIPENWPLPKDQWADYVREIFAPTGFADETLAPYRAAKEAKSQAAYEAARAEYEKGRLAEEARIAPPESIRQEEERIRQAGGVIQPTPGMAWLGSLLGQRASREKKVQSILGEISRREAGVKAQHDLELFLDSKNPKGLEKIVGVSPETFSQDIIMLMKEYSGGGWLGDADVDSIISTGGYKAFREFNETGRVPRNLDKHHPVIRRYIRDQWQKQNLEAIRSGKKLPYGQTGFLPNVAGDGSRSQFFYREDGSRIRPGDPEYADSIARAEAAGETVSRAAKIRNQRELERRAGKRGPAAANPAWETQGRMAADTPVRQREATVKNIGGNVSGYTDEDAKAAGIRPGDVIRDPNGNAVMMTPGGLLPATIGPRGDYVVDQRMAGMIQMMEQDPGMYAQARDSLAQYQRNPNSVYHDSAIRLRRNSDELMRTREAISSGNFNGNELRQLRRRERELQGNEVRIVQGYAERSGVLIGDDGEETGTLKWDTGAAVWTMKKANGDTEIADVGMYPGIPDNEVHEEGIRQAIKRMSGGDDRYGREEIDESEVVVTQEDLIAAYRYLSDKKAAESAAKRAASEAIRQGRTEGGPFSDPQSLLPGTEISPDLPPNVFYDSTGMLDTGGAHAGSVYIIDKATGRTKRVQISTFKTNQNVYMAAVQSGEVALVLPPGRSNLIKNKPIDRAAGR